MRCLALALAGITLVGPGCRSQPESTGTERPQPAAEKPTGDKASGPATVEIDSEMLRDLCASRRRRLNRGPAAKPSIFRANCGSTKAATHRLGPRSRRER